MAKAALIISDEIGEVPSQIIVKFNDGATFSADFGERKIDAQTN